MPTFTSKTLSKCVQPIYEKKINFESDTLLTIYLTPFSTDLEEVTITDNATTTKEAKLGLATLTQKQIANIPSIGSEHDIARILTLLPGVKNDNEGSAGLFVRGGTPDQNLFLLDNVPLYKNSHFFGFLSPFNSDIVQKIDFYKSGFPAQFGGRLSSILDVKTKSADLKQLRVSGTVGVLSSRLTVETPIIKNRMSLLLAARRSYFDIFTRFFQINSATDGPFYSFYDVNGKLTLKLNQKHILQVFSYQDRDRLRGGAVNETEDLQYNQKWNSSIYGLNFNSVSGQQLSNLFELNSTNYVMNLNTYRKQKDDVTNNDFSNSIRSYTVRNTTEIGVSDFYKVKLGAVFTNYLFKPSELNFEGNNIFYKTSIDSIRSKEVAFFAENELDFKTIKLNIGLRYASYQLSNKNYYFWEPRLVAIHTFRNSSVKFGYSKMNQPLHLLTNPGVGIPIDLWFSATDKILPQSSQQFSLAYNHDFVASALSLSVEAYYKTMNHIVNYQDGFSSQNFTQLRQNNVREWEKIVTTGNGQSYGTEWLLEKKKGRLTGWIGYTLSWTLHQFDDLNNGKPFFARHDRRHDFSVVLGYQLKKRWQFNATWIYQTGQAVTLPQAVYDQPAYDFVNNQFGNYTSILYQYGQRNGIRMKSTHRLDVSIQRKTTHKWGVGQLEISVYNAYNRKNPYFYYLALGEGIRSVSLFPIIPSIAYTFNIYTKPQ